MMGLIKNRIKVIGHHLTNLDSQPIGKAAMTVVIFLDLFILISIFDGLAEHTRQLVSPSEYVPRICQDIMIDGEWNETNRLLRISNISGRHRYSRSRPDQRGRLTIKHPICEPIMRLVYSIQDDELLSKNLADYKTLREQTRLVGAELGRVKGAYDTALLGKIAEQNQADVQVNSLKQAASRETGAIDRLVNQEQALKSILEQDRRLLELFELVATVTETDRSELLEELRHRNFWYPLQRLGMEMMFLLPLFLIFYFWNAKSIAKSRPLQSLVSYHLMIIVFIPVLFKITELLYDIIPRKLLQNLIAFLESLHLVALWHYLLMAVAIVFALTMIYIFQKKIFSHEKLLEKRIARGLCQSCGVPMAAGSAACTSCGFKQFRDCAQCNRPTYVYGKYCRECGHSE